MSSNNTNTDPTDSTETKRKTVGCLVAIGIGCLVILAYWWKQI